MAIFKCKMCGGDLEINDTDKVIECEYCGTNQTVPSADNEKKLNLFNRANRLRINGEFDKATAIYENIVAEFPEEAEAYWGLVICNYGIEYVDDPATARKIPTCHRASFESIQNDENFNMALEYADVVAQKIYRDEAREIDRIREEILAVSRNEQPYDIFICYKESAEDGERTVDSVIAQDLYDTLTDKGYKVFFARISLEDKLGSKYEPYIFAALNSAKIMLSIGTKYEYFHAVWVKNEWSRFLKLMAKDKSKVLIPCYKDMDAYDMPDEFKALQAQDLGKVGAVQDLVRGISKILGSTEKSQTVTVAPTTTGALTKRGYIFLEDGEYAQADSYFDKALDENPEDSKAYAGKVLVGLRKNNLAELDNSFVKLYEDKNFERAIRFAAGDDKAQLEGIKDRANKKWFAKCLSVGITKYAAQKETDEIKDKISSLIGTHTVEIYDEITAIYEDAYNRKVNPSYFTAHLIRTSKRKANILRLLTNGEEYTISDIKASTYFSDEFIPDYQIQSYLTSLIEEGYVEAGSNEDTYRLRLSEKERTAVEKTKEREKLYSDTSNMVNNAVDQNLTYSLNRWIDYAETLQQLGDYKDSAQLLKICQQKITEYDKHCDELKAIREKLKSVQNILSLDFFHIAGVKYDGTVVATGLNDYGQCNVQKWTDIVNISVGCMHTVGLKKDGTVVATGSNDCGQCNVQNWTDIINVYASAGTTFGLKKDGTVVATGSNDCGQCNVENWKDIIDISVGSYHTIGLKKDGTVVATGGNDKYRCDVQNWTDIVNISVHYAHTVGLKKDGTVVATGLNDYGQCNVESWTDIVDISVGSYHTIGLKKDGTVVATGRDDEYQCDVQEWTDIVAISTGCLHTIGLKKDGTVVSKGDWRNNQTSTYALTDIVAIAASKFYTVGLKKDGTVHANGWDDKKREIRQNWKFFNNFDNLEQEIIEIRLKSERRNQNLCQHCGGTFKGLFTKKCSSCGREKDY